MGIQDRLNALGRGAAQGATGMFGDEAFAKIMDYLPRPDDGTGIPREYAGGAQEQYLRSARADDADAAAKYPRNFGTGALAAAAPAAIAAAPAGIPGAVGMGALQGAGASERQGMGLVKDAVKGGALGGALGAAGNVAQAAAPAAKAALDKLRQGPPPGLQPALATAEAAPVARAARPELGGPQINKMVPPRPTTADLSEVMPETAEQRAIRAIEGRPSVPPEPMTIPKAAKVPDYHGMPEAEAEVLEQRLRQTEASGQKRLEAKFQNAQNPPKATVKPPRGKRAAKAPEQTGLALVEKQAPAPRPELTAANKPLVGPKQLSDDRILELARQTPESAPQPRAEMSPEQMESAKQALRDQFRKTASGGNVVNLDDGSLQVADNPFIAGTVREYQQNAKAALAAGDEDAAAWFKDKIESLLSAGGE